MKKKILISIITVIATLLLTPNVKALEKEPTVLKMGDETVVFANGLDITITAPSAEDQETYGAVIKYGDNKELKVVKGAWVFGGTHNDDSITTNTNITMEGGELYGIVAGGLHKSKVDNSTITINGGQLQSVYGGGVASVFFDAPTAEEKAHDYKGEAINSTTRVNNSNIIINDGKITKYIFGGGMGFNYTKDTSIIINGGDQSSAYLTAGGSNGYVKTTTIEINDGKIGVLQSVNRGSVESADVTINGGEITNAYVGGEPDTSVTGTIENASLTINSGKVENVNVGTNGGKTSPATDVATIKYNKGTVTNIDTTEFNEDKIEETVTIKFITDKEVKSVQIKTGSNLTEEELNEITKELESLLEKNGFELKGYYNEDTYETEFDIKNKIDSDKEIFVKYAEITKKENITTEEITNPNTADTNIYLTILIIISSVIGIKYTLKKRKFN